MIRLLAWFVVARDVVSWILIAIGVFIGLPIIWARIAELARALGLL